MQAGCIPGPGVGYLGSEWALLVRGLNAEEELSVLLVPRSEGQGRCCMQQEAYKWINARTYSRLGSGAAHIAF